MTKNYYVLIVSYNMLNDVKWAEDGVYAPHGKHTPLEFFSNALSNSVIFDIQLGYFNSAAINVLSTSFATFISNGGYMRMAINQIVSARDKEAISSGMYGGIEAPFNLDSWESIKDGLDEYGEHFFKCLAYLIQEKRIEIQIIKPKSTSGIAHTKKGMFKDEDGMIVGFSGSANFTLGGLFNNLEDISIFLSISPDESIQKRILNQNDEFGNIMASCQPDIEYLSPKDLEIAITNTYGNQDIEDLLDVELKLRSYKKNNKETLVLADNDTATYKRTPKFPYKEGPRDYQKQAFDNWKDNGQKGLFAMATGTGKTITSLNCLYEIYSRKQYYKAIILVPTVTLVNQWEEECKKFNFDNVIKVYSKNPFWQDELDRIVSKVREDCKNKNDYEKIIYVHDYLSSKVFYDFEAYEGNDSSYQSFSLIGPLIFSRGVCQGICLAASYLFEKLDIESEVILCYINSTRHTCNLVSYKEGNTVKKMILDITQDCKYDGDNSRYFYFIKQGKKIFPLTYFGFGISLDDYRNVARSYYLENLSLEDQKLINSLDNNYYYREKLYFHNFTELGLYISKLIGRRKTIQFYFDNDNYDPSLIVKKCSKMLSSHKINCLLQSNKIINRYVFIGGDLNER